MTTTVAGDAPSPGASRSLRPARRSRFLRVLLAVTVAIHVPVALGVAHLGAVLDWPHPWAIGLLWATAGSLLFVGRLRAAMPDRHRSNLVVSLLDVPYFIHWCAALWALVPSAVATLLWPIVALFRGSATPAPMGAYTWSY